MNNIFVTVRDSLVKERKPLNLHFTRLQNVVDQYPSGSVLRIVSIPYEELPKITIGMSQRIIFRKNPKILSSNKYIIGESYSLYDITTYQKFGLNIADNKFIVDLACKEGNIDFLKWWILSDIPLYYSENAIKYACQNANIDILNWWLESNLPIKYSYTALDCYHTDVNVLNWWINSGLELKYTEKTMDIIKFPKILDWWINSGLELKYSSEAMDRASKFGYVDVLNWWKNSGLTLKYTNQSVDNAYHHGKIKTLNWWLNSGLDIKYTPCIEISIGEFSDSKIVKIFEWWKNSGLYFYFHANIINWISIDRRFNSFKWLFSNNIKFEYSEESMDNLYNIEMLDIWKYSGLELKYTFNNIDYASGHKYIDTLNWWVNSGLELKYSKNAMDYCNHIDVLDWWINSGLELKYSKKSLDRILVLKNINERMDVLNWWINSGLELKYSEKYSDKMSEILNNRQIIL
ncbi:putative ankyrin repeat protein [Megavirus courdo11]|uniref:Putative ankyrin repeat protein n=1 Tax=Megavirus courdo11 TaxID=1128140 RepID=K7Y892_9VIRU|nr:putative ankyrin repeat protein [Megavirus courdo11]